MTRKGSASPGALNASNSAFALAAVHETEAGSGTSNAVVIVVVVVAGSRWRVVVGAVVGAATVWGAIAAGASSSATPVPPQAETTIIRAVKRARCIGRRVTPDLNTSDTLAMCLVSS